MTRIGMQSRAGIMLATVATLMVALLASSPAATATPAQAPGSRVSIDLPERFKVSPLFAGFMEIISSATVIIREMPPEAHERVTKGLSAEALAKKGVMNARPVKLNRNDDYFLMVGEQKFRRGLLEKFLLVLKDNRNTAVITFNVPKVSFTEASIKRADVLAALSSAKLVAKAAPSRDLFKLNYTGAFQLSGSPTGSSRTYAIPGEAGPTDSRNILVVAPSLNRLPIPDVKEFSQYAFKNLKTIQNPEIISTKDHRIDGMLGHEIIAKGKRGTGKVDVIVRQLMLAPKAGGYFRMLAVTKAADEARLANEIDKIFASFKVTGAGREF